MDNMIEVSSQISVGPQLDSDGWEQLAQKGYKTVINLSVKGELDQMKPEEEHELVSRHGLNYLHFPLTVSRLSQKHVDDFLAEVEGIELPAYVHCRLGQRSGPFALIWMAARRGLSFAHVRKRAAKLGFHWSSPFLPDFIRRTLLRLQEERAQPAKAVA